MPPGPIHLHIADVLTAVPAQMGVEAGMVVLTEDDEPFRSLRIIIGPTEANAVLAGWRGAVPGRPSTWDLFVSTVALLGGRMDRVVITAVQEERHYFAHLEIEQAGERRILACRPSDAIALAVRSYNADILAEPSVLEAAGVMPDGSKPGPAADTEVDEAVTLAAREAALAEREAVLAARERVLAGVAAPAELSAVAPTELGPGAEPAATEVATDPTEATTEPAGTAEAPPAPSVVTGPVSREAAGPATGPPATPG